MNKPVVAVIMGSKSDLPILQNAFKVFDHFGVGFTARVLSAHRTPCEAAEFASGLEKNGYKVVICAAGMAAHLGGVVAAHTTLPVIGLPVASEPFNGLDALFSIVQMPPGIPVAAVTAGKAGGKNAALYAVSILALSDSGLAARLREYRAEQREMVLNADAELQEELKER
ncbi:5-(carboxyamino)imidazole ribonucleotide mutase [uncultured Victivallis sp.]|uniref:5-(carboxyamino)imidazole ribonucleotide mutase n=1 Tax=Victivallis sp. TaxID=2049020 RepID=UPI0025DAEA55|nr:5-(carboxyamino)imidazole ribonucleotide mutase [uncultured Victivallis sp.]